MINFNSLEIAERPIAKRGATTTSKYDMYMINEKGEVRFSAGVMNGKENFANKEINFAVDNGTVYIIANLESIGSKLDKEGKPRGAYLRGRENRKKTGKVAASEVTDLITSAFNLPTEDKMVVFDLTDVSSQIEGLPEGFSMYSLSINQEMTEEKNASREKSKEYLSKARSVNPLHKDDNKEEVENSNETNESSETSESSESSNENDNNDEF